ncbi:MAG: NAD(P)/FAD-dependent oxidoreductase [Gammaproteobacteria bacterium]
MRICVVGLGISGLTAANVLARRHQVTALEANHYAGGHTNTVGVRDGDRTLAVDTGFIVFNEPNYPNLCRLFDRLGVRSRDSDMSFSVQCRRSGVEWNGSSLNRIFVQRANLLRPSHWCMLADIVRFHREARSMLTSLEDAVTVDEWLSRRRFGRAFVERYLLPLGASLWSCSPTRFRAFPMRFVIEFLHNHCMLQGQGRPVWKTVVGGSREYVAPLMAPFARHVHLGTAVRSVRRVRGGVEVRVTGGRKMHFDEVVLACHADQSLRLLIDADPLERDVLGAFPYQPNEAVLHTDTRLLPTRRAAWASWNYRVPAEPRAEVCVTYNLNRLQGLDSQTTWCVSLNPGGAIDPAKVVRRFRYHHPLFTARRFAAQARHDELVRRRRVSFCGAYWGYGFHEDGVRSALAMCEGIDQELEVAA